MNTVNENNAMNQITLYTFDEKPKLHCYDSSDDDDDDDDDDELQSILDDMQRYDNEQKQQQQQMQKQEETKRPFAFAAESQNDLCSSNSTMNLVPIQRTALHTSDNLDVTLQQQLVQQPITVIHNQQNQGDCNDHTRPTTSNSPTNKSSTTASTSSSTCRIRNRLHNPRLGLSLSSSSSSLKTSRMAFPQQQPLTMPYTRGATYRPPIPRNFFISPPQHHDWEQIVDPNIANSTVSHCELTQPHSDEDDDDDLTMALYRSTLET
jgi:hypothetical protein